MCADVTLSLKGVQEVINANGHAVKLEDLGKQVAGYFEQFRDAVYCYLVSFGVSAADAEELTQEAFLRLYHTLHAGQSLRNVRSWVFQTARNLAIDRYRKNARIQTLEVRAEEESATNEEAGARDLDEIATLADWFQDPNLNPEQQVLQRERWRWLEKAWRALAPRQKQCLQLRIEGLRYREIAEVLGIGITSVEGSILQGIAKLKGSRDSNETD